MTIIPKWIYSKNGLGFQMLKCLKEPSVVVMKHKSYHSILKNQNTLKKLDILQWLKS